MNIYFTPGNADSEQAAIQKLHAFLWPVTDSPDLRQTQARATHSHVTNAACAFREKKRKTYAATDPEGRKVAFLRIVLK